MNIVKNKLVLAGACAALWMSMGVLAQDNVPPPADAAAADAAVPAADAAAPVEAAPAEAAPMADAGAAPETASYAEPAPGSVAEATPWYSSMLSDFDFSIGGFIRPEVAVSTGDANPNNQTGNPYNK